MDVLDGRLAAVCRATLERDDRGSYTVPAPLTYPHQWNWDSAFVALGWLEISPERAWRELESLLAAQQPNGLVPHLIYATPAPIVELVAHLHDVPVVRRLVPALVGRRYSPSPAWWGWRRGGDGRFCSAITQPPVAATATWLLFEATGDEPRARALLPALARCHRFLLDERDPLGLGEPVLIHPWESGRDNAPEWDAPLDRVRPEVTVVPRPDRDHVDAAERPSDDHYRRFLTLVRRGTRSGWRQRELAARGPFRVLDPGFSAILARACADLSRLADALGERRLAEVEAARAERVAAALAARTGGDGLARAIDLADDSESDALSCGSALALVAPSLSAASLDALEQVVLQGPLASPFGVRSLDRGDRRLRPRCYWRGPVWVNVGWLCALGLATHGRRRSSALLIRRVVECVRAGGVREYYAPGSGRGLGAHDFAWTAALCLRELGPRGLCGGQLTTAAEQEAAA